MLAGFDDGLALSLLANEEFSAALALIEGLLLQDSDNLFYLDTYTDLAIEMKQYQKAKQMLSAQLVHTPYNRVLTLNLANLLIQMEEFESVSTEKNGAKQNGEVTTMIIMTIMIITNMIMITVKEIILAMECITVTKA